eukprot:m.172831 g.172831  ORF g.172831 m.172831 type:complete len:148 (-) comp16726_c0_seq33:518-961(-)
MQTAVSSPNHYADALRACLIASLKRPETAISTIKMSAMNLIAANRIDEGIELLVLIGFCKEACRYLQSYGRWHDAITLAKTTLPVADACDVVLRHAKQLESIGCWQDAILFYVSASRFDQVCYRTMCSGYGSYDTPCRLSDFFMNMI